MSKVVGFVEKINSKSGKSQKTGRPWTLYSMKLSDKEGNELDGWFQCGFDKPGCNEGDYIQVEVTANGDNFDVTKDSVKVAKNPPAKPKNESSGGNGGGAGRAPKVSELFGEIGGYNTEDDIRRMSYSAARSDAIKATELLLESNAIKLVKADSKAGFATRFDLITEIIDKLTVEFFFDAATGRKLETVADAGVVSVEGDGDLPDADDVDFEDAPDEDLEDSTDFAEEDDDDADFE